MLRTSIVIVLPLACLTISGSVPDSGLINGKGRYVGGPTVDRAVLNVTPGKRYRFRVINISAIGSYTFSIEGHSLTIIVRNIIYYSVAQLLMCQTGSGWYCT